MRLLREESHCSKPACSICGPKLASTLTHDCFCFDPNVRDVGIGIRILTPHRKTNQHCLSVLNRGSRDEHRMPRIRNLAATATRAGCEDPVAMCEPGHRRKDWIFQKTKRRSSKKNGGFVHRETLRINTQDQHVVCVICPARSWRTERPNIGWPPFDLVLAVCLRRSGMTI